MLHPASIRSVALTLSYIRQTWQSSACCFSMSDASPRRAARLVKGVSPHECEKCEKLNGNRMQNCHIRGRSPAGLYTVSPCLPALAKAGDTGLGFSLLYLAMGCDRPAQAKPRVKPGETKKMG